MLITKTSSLTGVSHTIDINISKEELERVNSRYENGELIQNIVPTLSYSDREFLMTGITQEEWDMHMVDED
jgi:hypothetical protein